MGMHKFMALTPMRPALCHYCGGPGYRVQPLIEVFGVTLQELRAGFKNPDGYPIVGAFPLGDDPLICMMCSKRSDAGTTDVVIAGVKIAIRVPVCKELDCMEAMDMWVKEYMRASGIDDKDIGVKSWYLHDCEGCKKYKGCMPCGGCKNTWYCSAECQKKDWVGGGHKTRCSYRKK
jgi:hypothetical protein